MFDGEEVFNPHTQKNLTTERIQNPPQAKKRRNKNGKTGWGRFTP